MIPEVLMIHRYNKGYRSNYPGEIRGFYFINQVRPGRVSVPDVNGVSAGLGVWTSVSMRSRAIIVYIL